MSDRYELANTVIDTMSIHFELELINCSLHPLIIINETVLTCNKESRLDDQLIVYTNKIIELACLLK